MDQIIRVAWELNEKTDNRYKLVYEIAELAKKLVDETQMKKARDEFGFDEVVQENSFKKENSAFFNHVPYGTYSLYGCILYA